MAPIIIAIFMLTAAFPISIAFSAHNSPFPTLVLLDGFSEYLSGECRKYCIENNIQLKELFSPYIYRVLEARGQDPSVESLAPVKDEDILAWGSRNEIGQNEHKDDLSTADFKKLSNRFTYIIAESDSGVSTAEKMAAILGLIGNGMSPHLRNKFQSNLRVSSAGLPTVQQQLVSDLDAALAFANMIWKDVPISDRKCVVKPYRGVASDGVYLCTSETEITEAFSTLINAIKYGGGINEAVLVQEYADGTEYAVDTIAQDGIIKVIALWRYHKLSANGSPFVYQCTELVDISSDEERAVCEYCLAVLAAQELTWGPTHTEIKATSRGPRLIEINARWHGQNFPALTRACLGNDAVYCTLDTVFKPDKFQSIPRLPNKKLGAGRIVHLISSVEGVVTSVNHLDEIRSMESVKIVDIEHEVGGRAVKSVDLRSDAGYIVMYHENKEVVERDYLRILELQTTLFSIEN